MQNQPNLENLGQHSDTGQNIKLATLIQVRWLAVFGQSATVLFTTFYLSFELPFALCFMVIACSAWLNLGLRLRYSANTRLSPKHATLQLGWDIFQLATLLFLTGGLQNPFIFLFLVPVLVSAASLPIRWTLGLAGFVSGLATSLSFFSFPLPWAGAAPLYIPPLFQFALWVSLHATLIFAIIYARQVARESRMMENALFAAELVLAREQQISALDGLAAAAAHELGTPLGTIALVTKEMSRALKATDPMHEDVQLLGSQVERCRSILAKLTSMSTADNSPFFHLSLQQLFADILEPFENSDVQIITHINGPDPEPVILRNPAVLYGLGNLVENAVDFARTQVELHAHWTETELHLSISDDGSGFSPEMLKKIGEPYLTSRPIAAKNSDQEAAGGLGLGFFIAKTLLERSGAKLFTGNKTQQTGAIIKIVWKIQPENVKNRTVIR